MILTDQFLIDKAKSNFKCIKRNGLLILQQDDSGYFGKLWQGIQKQSGIIKHQTKYRIILNTLFIEKMRRQNNENLKKHNHSASAFKSPYNKTYIIAISDSLYRIKEDYEYLTTKVQEYFTHQDPLQLFEHSKQPINSENKKQEEEQIGNYMKEVLTEDVDALNDQDETDGEKLSDDKGVEEENDDENDEEEQEVEDKNEGKEDEEDENIEIEEEEIEEIKERMKETKTLKINSNINHKKPYIFSPLTTKEEIKYLSKEEIHVLREKDFEKIHEIINHVIHINYNEYIDNLSEFYNQRKNFVDETTEEGEIDSTIREGIEVKGAEIRAKEEEKKESNTTTEPMGDTKIDEKEHTTSNKEEDKIEEGAKPDEKLLSPHLYDFRIHLYDAFVKIPICQETPNEVIEFAHLKLKNVEEKLLGYQKQIQELESDKKTPIINECHKAKSNLYSLLMMIKQISASFDKLSHLVLEQYKNVEEEIKHVKVPHPFLKFVTHHRGLCITYSHQFERDLQQYERYYTKYKEITKPFLDHFLAESIKQIQIYRVYNFLLEKAVELSQAEVDRTKEEGFKDPFQIYPFIEDQSPDAYAQELTIYNTTYILEKLGNQYVKSIRRIFGALVSLTASQHYINEKTDVKSDYLEKFYLSAAGIYYAWNRQAAAKNVSQFFANVALEKGSKIWNMQEDALIKPFIHTSLPSILYSQPCSINSFAPRDDSTQIDILFGETNANGMLEGGMETESQEAMLTHLQAMQVHFQNVVKKCEDITKQLELQRLLELIDKAIVGATSKLPIDIVEYNYIKGKFAQTEREWVESVSPCSQHKKTRMCVSVDRMMKALKTSNNRLAKMNYPFKRIKMRFVSSRPFNSELFLPFHFERKTFAYIDHIKTSVTSSFKSIWNRYMPKKVVDFNMVVPDNYRATDGKLLIHFHGGGFIAMSSFGHESYLRRWSNDLQIPIISIDYHKAPECQYPALLEECVFAYKWCLKHASIILGCELNTILMGGDSAGGNLSLAVTGRAIAEKFRAPDLLILTYPATNLNLVPSPARLQSMIDPLVNFGFLRVCMDAYYSRDADPLNDPFLSPSRLPDEVLEKFPPCYFNVGTLDPLFDDTVTMAKRLAFITGKVYIDVYDGLGHGYLNMLNVSKTSDLVHQRLIAWVNRFLKLDACSSPLIHERLDTPT